jgi:predicted RNase H-like HicB family nuclease
LNTETSQQAAVQAGIQEYVFSAMAKARYQILEDETWYADVFLCPGVWAIGDTAEECRDALQHALADWLISAYQGRDPAPNVTELAWLNPRWHHAGD